ncbi:MAG: exodeoxyribonuclease VII large subunit [Candidatus Dasytiphilus stammeri]
MSDIYLSSTTLTVSQLNQIVRKLLENKIGQIWLSAEVSNFSKPISGHWYFTLKDDTAQVRCVMFRSCNKHILSQPQNGQQVLVLANITLYDIRGDYQLIINNLSLIGDGLLNKKYTKLKKLLAAEGLFAKHLKKTLPQPAHKIGIITSTTGAAVCDIIRILNRRDPLLPVIIYPTIVQGDQAPKSIIRAISIANQRQECDVLIIARGGGTLEDLWGFNDETLARTIFYSKIPIVSAVGHETDITIADLVADIRAPTPSAAAEIVSRNQIELFRKIQNLQQRLEMAIDFFLDKINSSFTYIHQKLQQLHPQLYIFRQKSILRTIIRLLTNLIQKKIIKSHAINSYYEQRLFTIHFIQDSILIYKQQLQKLQSKLQNIMINIITDNRQKIRSKLVQLESMSPIDTINRGYNLTYLLKNDTENIVNKIHHLQIGDIIKIRFTDGYAISKVLFINCDDSNID